LLRAKNVCNFITSRSNYGWTGVCRLSIVQYRVIRKDRGSEILRNIAQYLSSLLEFAMTQITTGTRGSAVG